jgi:DNA (cytosine-5)-methyltransferase 1
VQSGYGEREGQVARTLDLLRPMGTLVGGAKQALVASFLAKHFGGVVGQEMGRPLPTVTTVDHSAVVEAACVAKFRGTNGQRASQSVMEPLPTISAGGLHVAEVRAFLTTYYKSERAGQPVTVPLRTITTKDRLGLVTIEGAEYQIVDIGMRMLQPHELLAGQFGRFAARYDLSAAPTKTDQVRLIGNSVCPEVAEAIVLANVVRVADRVAA